MNTKLSPVEPDSSYHRRYAGAVLVERSGNLILQVRDQKPDIANPGQTALFGGGQNQTELPIDCIVRELYEELELRTDPTHLEFLGYIDKTEPTDNTITRCAIFRLQNIDPSLLQLREGKGIAIESASSFLANPSVSEIAKIAIKAASG